MEKYIDFTVDYEGQCECIDDFTVGNDNIDIDESNVDELIEKLNEIDGFNLSQHRTQVRIWWNEDGTMDIRYRSYTEPDWGSFEDYELLGLPQVEFEEI